jgi:beta-lactamase class A
LANGLKVAITGLPGNVAGAIVIPNGQGVEQNFNQPVPGASLLYLWIAATAYEEEAGGRFPLGETYTLKASDQVQGTGILKNADRVGKSFSYAELVETMLVYSDHTAASLVLNRLGLAKVNDYARRNDYRVTTIQVNPASPEAATKNLTSARDCALIIDNLLKKKVVSTPVSEKILSELKTRRAYEDISTDFFGRNVPDNLDYTHISGVLPGVRNELGYYVTKSGGPVIIVLLSSNNSGTEAAVETALGQSIAQVLKTVP